jgi:recombination protein RecT
MAKQQVATQPKSESRPIDLFKASLDRAAPMILNMLPAHMRNEAGREKFIAMVVTAVAYSDKLLTCTPHSLLRATAEAAELGLSLNQALKEADILPVWSPNGTVAQMRPRYMGLLKLARQSGEMKEIYAHEVRDGDEFDYAYGLDKKLHHKPGSKRGKLTHVYCVWETKDGVKSFEVLDEERVLKSRDKSEGWKAFAAGKIKSTPWKDDEAEMWRKTAVRAASKYMPMSSDKFAAAVAIDNAREVGEAVILTPDGDVQSDPEAVDITATDTPTEAAQSQVASLEQRITAPVSEPVIPAGMPVSVNAPSQQPTATMPQIPAEMRRQAPVDYVAWADRAVAEVDKLDAQGCTAWRKKNNKALQDAEFSAPDQYARVKQALDG